MEPFPRDAGNGRRSKTKCKPLLKMSLSFLNNCSTTVKVQEERRLKVTECFGIRSSEHQDRFRISGPCLSDTVCQILSSFDQLSSFSGLFRSQLVTFLVTFLPESAARQSQIPFAGLLLRQAGIHRACAWAFFSSAVVQRYLTIFQEGRQLIKTNSGIRPIEVGQRGTIRRGNGPHPLRPWGWLALHTAVEVSGQKITTINEKTHKQYLHRIVPAPRDRPGTVP